MLFLLKKFERAQVEPDFDHITLLRDRNFPSVDTLPQAALDKHRPRLQSQYDWWLSINNYLRLNTSIFVALKGYKQRCHKPKIEHSIIRRPSVRYWLRFVSSSGQFFTGSRKMGIHANFAAACASGKRPVDVGSTLQTPEIVDVPETSYTAMDTKVVNLEKNMMDVVAVKETYVYEQCLSEHEIGLARELLREHVVVSYESSCFSIYSPNGYEANSTQMCFRINLLQRGKLRHYMFEDTDNERIVEVSIHEKKYARVVLSHKKNSERTKLYELQEFAVLREVFPGRKYLSFGNSSGYEDVVNN